MVLGGFGGPGGGFLRSSGNVTTETIDWQATIRTTKNTSPPQGHRTQNRTNKIERKLNETKAKDAFGSTPSKRSEGARGGQLSFGGSGGASGGSGSFGELGFS